MNLKTSSFRKNYKSIIGVILLAFLLWFMVKMNRVYEYAMNIPIRFVNLDENKIFRQPQVKTVRVEFIGKGKDLIRLHFYKAYYEIDLSGSPLHFEMDLSEHPEYVNFPEALDVRVKSIIRPRTISVDLDEKMVKKLPVEVKYELEEVSRGRIIGIIERSIAFLLTVTGNIGTAWRAPTLFELFASGPRLGEARYEIGNADLDKETSLNMDGGIRFDRERVHAHVAAYRNKFQGFLYIQPTNEMRQGYQVFNYEQADALLQGGEASVQVEPNEFLSVTASGDYVRGTNELTDEPLPLIPPARYDFEAEVHGPWAGRQGYVSGEVQHVSAPSRLNPYDLAVDAYTLVNLGAGFRGTFRGRRMGLDLRVENLANTSYKDFLSRYKRFALNPGRNITLRVRTGL